MPGILKTAGARLVLWGLLLLNLLLLAGCRSTAGNFFDLY